MTEDRKRLLPWWWYVILLLLAVAGIWLICLNPQLPQEFGRFSKRVRPDAWSTFAGILLLSIVLTHLLIFGTSRLLRSLLRLHGDDSHADMWAPALVGISESVMYPMTLFLGKPEFIGVWLAVKVAGQWVRWKGDAGQSPTTVEPDIDKLNEGRRRFNGFLVGSSLSIMSGTATCGALKIWALI
jgi:hypothetical protein